MKNLQPGINPVLMTPLKDSGGIDSASYRYTVKHLLEKGVHGVVVLGSMGELPYLSAGERQEALEAVVEACDGKTQVIAGTTAFGTDEAVTNARAAAKYGVDGLLVPLPLYFKIGFSEIFDFFKRIAGETGLPILYYHFPSVTHLNLKGEEIARLLEIENVVGVKESVMDLTVIRKHMRIFPKNALVFSGSSLLMEPVFKIGGSGAICPIPCIIPEATLELYEACVNKNTRAASQAEKKVFQLAPLFSDFSFSPNALRHIVKIASRAGLPLKGAPPAHAQVKEALRLMGHPISPAVKAPLPALTDKQARKVKRILKNAGLI